MKGFYSIKNKKTEQDKLKALRKAESLLITNPVQTMKELKDYQSKRDPNKIEMMENIIWTFLEHEAKDYKNNETACINEEDGVFKGYLKQCSTMLQNICTHESRQIDVLYRRGYTQQKTTDFNTEFVTVYLKRALADESTEDTKVLEMDYVEGKLGHYGCLLFKNYVALKAARLYIQDKFRNKSDSMKKVIVQIKKIESFWEKSVII